MSYKSGVLVDRSLKCTECGKTMFILNKLDYVYRTHFGFQCSYTCYDHAILRKIGDKGVSRSVTLKRLKDCEEVMKVQGKTIICRGCKNE